MSILLRGDRLDKKIFARVVDDRNTTAFCGHGKFSCKMLRMSIDSFLIRVTGLRSIRDRSISIPALL